MKYFFVIISFYLFFSSSCTLQKKRNENWTQLFNGENLNGWEIKIAGFELGDNYLETFRVENGNLVVCYDEYEAFGNRFGHLFTEKSYSHYKLRVEYRIVGEQLEDAPAWAYRNNGLMLHSQSAESMGIDQYFPTSIEVQLYGGVGDDHRTNLNVCTPGTIIDINDELMTEHCFNSDLKVINGEDWVTVEVEVQGDSLIKHLYNGEVVLSYNNIRFDLDSPENDILLQGEFKNLKLSEGKIAIQSESHRTEFRKIELLDLTKK
ncbi:MAG: DUF1080 domain-containing protein [Prolixibacteraceae bacterium]|jgi:hypothetical protein|nr:DUF1080 domain-containing protein [Prolixibacteraceae bacterium]